MFIDGYRSTRLTDVIRITDIFTIHYFEYTKDFRFPGESHDFWEICYVDDGAVDVHANGKWHTLYRGDAIFHRPNEFHELRTSGRTAPNIVVVTFACDNPAMKWFDSRLLSIGESDRQLMGRIVREARHCFSTRLDDPLTDGLDRSTEQRFGGEQVIRICLEELLINLVRSDLRSLSPGRRETAIARGINDSAFFEVVNYMSSKIDANVTLADICKATGFSRSHLYEIFKRRTGLSATEYYKHLRVSKAKQMIRQGGRNISEVANALDFSSIQYFSRLFKKWVGMTPSAYAASVKINSEFEQSSTNRGRPGLLDQ